MSVDKGEKLNAQDKYPELTTELKILLIKYIKEGRSTPGTVQKNDEEHPWKQVEWMD